MKKITVFLMLLTMSMMLFVGCGGNDTSETKESSETKTEVSQNDISENTEEEKEVVKANGIQTIEGKNEYIDFTLTYDGDVLALKNDDLSDVYVLKFDSLEDKSRLWVYVDEKNFSGDNSLNRIYTRRQGVRSRLPAHS